MRSEPWISPPGGQLSVPFRRMLDDARPVQRGADALVRAPPRDRTLANARGVRATAGESLRIIGATPAWGEALKMAFTFFFRDQQVLERVVGPSGRECRTA